MNAQENGQEIENEQVLQDEMVNEAEAEATDVEQEISSESEVDPKDAEINELKTRLLRLQADFDNFRKRTTTEREQLSTYVTSEVVNKFLKVLDNFERADAAAQNSNDIQTVLDGMDKIKRQFATTLTELGVKEIEAEGVKFNPEVHEAVLRGQNPEMEEDTIDMVLEKGYEVNGRVIRHSKVRVISND